MMALEIHNNHYMINMQKKNVIIWGAGEKLDIVFSTINKKVCSVIAIVDRDASKQNTMWKSISVISPDDVDRLVFDYVIVSVKNYEAVAKSILGIGINPNKIICFWNEQDAHSDLFDYIETIKGLERQRDIYRNRLINRDYEDNKFKEPRIKDAETTLQTVIDRDCSLTRFGDGEWDLIFGRNRSWFQRTDSELSKRLKEVFECNDDGLLVAIADNFSNLDKYTEEAADGIREYMVKSRNDVESIIDFDREYYDAYVTRPYIIYRERNKADVVFSLFKKIWENKRILIVEGCESRTGVNNDLLDSAKSVIRIICPQKNSWDYYDDILLKVSNHLQEVDIVCVSLGATATVLAYDVHQMGMQILDIGQLDNEYEWFLRGVDYRVAIPGKMVSEIGNGVVLDEDSQFIEDYYESIVERIGES